MKKKCPKCGKLADKKISADRKWTMYVHDAYNVCFVRRKQRVSA